MAVTEIAMHDIEVSDDRARTDHGDLEQLAASIKAVGQLQPIVVRPTERGYELVAGERRFRAQELLGAMMIRAEVRDLDDDEVLVAEAVENGQRKSFTPSEYAWLGLQLEERAKTEDMVGKLPSGDRLSERVAKALGVSDRTYRKARDIVSLCAELNDVPISRGGFEQASWQVCDRLVRQMDESGKVDGAHRQFVALRRLLDLSTHEDATVAEMATSTITRSATEPGIDLTLEVEGIESYQAPAGSGAEEPSEREEVHGAAVGSDVTSPVASEPAEHPHGFGCRACGVLVDLGSDDSEPTICPRCDGEKWYRAEYPVGPFGLINDDVVIFHTVPSLTDGDAALVTCDGCDAAVFVPPATGHDLLLGACPVCSKIDWSPATINGVDVNHGGNIGPIGSVEEQPEEQVVALPDFDALTGQQREALVTLWKAGEALRYSNHTTVSSIHHKVADGLAELGLVAVEVPPGGTFDDREVGLTIDGQRIVEQFARDWWRAQRAGLNLASDWQLAGPEPHPWTRTFTVFVGRGKCRALVIGYGDTRLSPILDTRAEADAWLDAQRPAPAAVTGSEPPAPQGVNEDHGTPLEGDELAPDPSTPVTATTEVEGEDSDGAVPAPRRSEDGEGEIRRSPSPSTTARSPKPNPVRAQECSLVVESIRDLCNEINRHVPAVSTTDVMRYLATLGPDGGSIGDDLREDLALIVPFLTDLRGLTIKSG